MPRTRTPRQWREILETFGRSDLIQAEFCRRCGLALANFRYRRARAAARPELSDPPRVVELFAEPATHSVGDLRLELDLPLGPVTIHGQAAPLAELLHLLVLPPATARP